MVNVKQKLKAAVTRTIDKLIEYLESGSEEELNNKWDQDNHGRRLRREHLESDSKSHRAAPGTGRSKREARRVHIHEHLEQPGIENLEASDLEFKAIAHLGSYEIARTRSRNTSSEKYGRTSNQTVHFRSPSPLPEPKKLSRSEGDMGFFGRGSKRVASAPAPGRRSDELWRQNGNGFNRGQPRHNSQSDARERSRLRQEEFERAQEERKRKEREQNGGLEAFDPRVWDRGYYNKQRVGERRKGRNYDENRMGKGMEYFRDSQVRKSNSRANIGVGERRATSKEVAGERERGKRGLKAVKHLTVHHEESRRKTVCSIKGLKGGRSPKVFPKAKRCSQKSGCHQKSQD